MPARLITPLGSGTGRFDRAVFVKAYCDEHSPPVEHFAVVTEKQVGKRIDEVEFHRIRRHLMAQPEIYTCPECGKRMTRWSSDLSTFGAYRETEERAWAQIDARARLESQAQEASAQ